MVNKQPINTARDSVVMKILFTILALLFSLPSLAGWSDSLSINQIITEGNDDGRTFVLVVSPTVSSKSIGAPCTGQYHNLDASTGKWKLMFSMLLIEKAMRNSVWLIFHQANNATVIGVR